MTVLLCIDPGSTASGLWRTFPNSASPDSAGKLKNEQVLGAICGWEYDEAYLELPKYLSSRVKAEYIVQTLLWTGEFVRELKRREKPYFFVYRDDVKKHLKVKGKSADSKVRAAVIERLEPNYDRHRNPGVLRDVKADAWQAGAISIYVFDRQEEERKRRAA